MGRLLGTLACVLVMVLTLASCGGGDKTILGDLEAMALQSKDLPTAYEVTGQGYSNGRDTYEIEFSVQAEGFTKTITCEMVRFASKIEALEFVTDSARELMEGEDGYSVSGSTPVGNLAAQFVRASGDLTQYVVVFSQENIAATIEVSGSRRTASSEEALELSRIVLARIKGEE